MEAKYKYFIENIDTNLWYRNQMTMQIPHIHTYGKGWDCPDPLPHEYWTSDPHLALQFDDPKNGIDFMNTGLKRVGNRGQFTNWVQFSDGESGRAKSLLITEHEFI